MVKKKKNKTKTHCKWTLKNISIEIKSNSKVGG